MTYTHRGCSACPKLSYRCQDCIDRLHATALAEGPEKNRQQPFVVPTIPTLTRVVRKGSEWIFHCDVYIGGRLACGKPWNTIQESKWFNNFDSLAQYEDHVRSSQLWEQLGELSGMFLGCTTATDLGHGAVLRRLFAERFQLE